MIRFASHALLFGLLQSPAAIGAAHAEFVEAPFAPAIGSRWIVDDVQDSETLQANGKTERRRVTIMPAP